MVASSKCDSPGVAHKASFKIDSLAAGKATFGSSKCDWNIALGNFKAASQPGEGKFDLSGFAFDGPSQISSAKCDWSIQTGDIRAKFAKPGIQDLNAPLAGGKIAVSSSKCDWALKVTEGPNKARNSTMLDAKMTSSKCDFSLVVEVGMDKGSKLRMHAVGSAKCDFRLDRLERSDARGKNWSPVEGSPTKK